MCLLSHNQFQILLRKLCPQQNFPFITSFSLRFFFVSTFLQQHAAESCNSFTHASYTCQLHNCGGNEHEEAANWYGNNVSDPTTRASAPTHHLLAYARTVSHTYMNAGKVPGRNWCISSSIKAPFPGKPDSGSSLPLCSWNFWSSKVV